MKTKWVVFVASIFCIGSIGLASEAIKGAQKDIDQFKMEMSEKVKSIENQISQLKENARTKKNSAKDKTIHELEVSRDKIKAELSEVKMTSEQRWSEMKKNIGKSVDGLNARIQKALKD